MNRHSPALRVANWLASLGLLVTLSLFLIGIYSHSTLDFRQGLWLGLSIVLLLTVALTDPQSDANALGEKPSDTIAFSSEQQSINHLIHSALGDAAARKDSTPNEVVAQVLQNLESEYKERHAHYLHFVVANTMVSKVMPGQPPELGYLREAIAFTKTLADALRVKTLYEVSKFLWPNMNPSAVLIFPPQLCEAVDSLRQIGDTVDRALETTAPLTMTSTLWEVSDQIVHLTRAQYALRDLGEGFGPVLALVIGHFADVLKEAGERVREEQQRGPVPNPYVIGNPVQGPLFVGREDVLRRLEELWGSSGQCPSVVLYGHRRMGKSSVLQNLGRLRLSEQSVLVDFNLQRIGRVRSTAELLHGLSLKLYDAAAGAGLGKGTLVEPLESDFLAEGKNPYLAFDRFLDKLGRLRDGHRFLLTIDEFELFEEQIDEGRLDPHLLASFRAAFQTYPWLIMALAGLHRLEELRHDYWNPLFGSVSAIEVSFLSDGAARTLITSPAPDFPIDYDTPAIARIIELTHGQPYLIQLICHSLVARHNRQLTTEPIPPLRRFFLSDVEAVVNEPELFTDGIRYFQGVWDHASRSTPPGQTAVLTALAEHPEGLTEPELPQHCGLSPESLQAALRALLRHAVVQHDGTKYRFTVELLRRWVATQSAALPQSGASS